MPWRWVVVVREVDVPERRGQAFADPLTSTSRDLPDRILPVGGPHGGTYVRVLVGDSEVRILVLPALVSQLTSISGHRTSELIIGGLRWSTTGGGTN